MLGGRTTRFVAVIAICAAALVATIPSVHAQTAAPTTATTPYSAPPKAYIVVDQQTGTVLASSNDRTPLPPASLTKILTALAAVAALNENAKVPISVRAQDMPARKLNMKAGEVWPVQDVLSSLLASSANDAGAALAERISGTMEKFNGALDKLADHLEMADAPELNDPSGLDDEFSVRGGNMISARDLAIAARAVLANERIASIVRTPVIEFVGPDGQPHRLGNHNKMLKTYPGAIGMKTGYTKKSGRGLIAAATRNGRTQIAVLMNVGDTYGWAAQLLDAAFAQPIPTGADRLPAIPPPLRLKAAPFQPPAAVIDPTAVGTDAATATTAAPVVEDPADVIVTKPAASSKGGVPLLLKLPLIVISLLAVAWGVLRTRVLLRRYLRRRRRANAQIKRHVHRRRDPVLTPHYRPDTDEADRYHELTRQ